MAEQHGYEIKMGQAFEGNDLWENLPEGCGIVAVYCNGSKSFAYGDSTNDEEILEKNLAGATVAYGANAFLAKKENGVWVCHRRRRAPVGD